MNKRRLPRWKEWYEAFRANFEQGKQIFELIAAIVTIGGWIVVAFAFGRDLLPGAESRAFAKSVSELRLGQNYAFIERKLGMPVMLEDVSYTTDNQTVERGAVATYYGKEYVVLTYFDKDDNLFGYVVMTNSKHFAPKIPNTITEAGDGRQRLRRLQLKAANPYSYTFKDGEPALAHQYIAARRSGPDLEKYYVEIYDLLSDGYLGFAVTDIMSESARMENVFARLSEMTKPEENNPFYRQYKKQFDSFDFM